MLYFYFSNYGLELTSTYVIRRKPPFPLAILGITQHKCTPCFLALPHSVTVECWSYSAHWLLIQPFLISLCTHSHLPQWLDPSTVYAAHRPQELPPDLTGLWPRSLPRVLLPSIFWGGHWCLFSSVILGQGLPVQQRGPNSVGSEDCSPVPFHEGASLAPDQIDLPSFSETSNIHLGDLGCSIRPKCSSFGNEAKSF